MISFYEHNYVPLQDKHRPIEFFFPSFQNIFKQQTHYRNFLNTVWYYRLAVFSENLVRHTKLTDVVAKTTVALSVSRPAYSVTRPCLRSTNVASERVFQLLSKITKKSQEAKLRRKLVKANPDRC
jgi:hypothetical protein